MEKNEVAAVGGQKTIVIALVAVVVVLAGVIVGLVVLRKPASPSVASPEANGGTATSGTGGMPSTVATAPFDPKTATKVAKGSKPEDHVKAYFEAVVKGDFATAYKLLPADKRAAQDEASFAEQLKGYGITGYTIDDVTEKGDETRVLATATMAGGNFQYLWTFVKDGDAWLLKSRTLPGMN